MMCIFEKISDSERRKLEEELFCEVIKELRKETLSDGFYLYEVQLQKSKFRTAMLDAELKEVIGCTIDLLEELKIINQNGINRTKLMEIEDAAQKDCGSSEGFFILRTMQEITTEKLGEIVFRIAAACRVGGAYFIFISNPMLQNVILAVYEVIVDKFNDNELYRTCAWFMLRGIMHLNSESIKEKDGKTT